MARDEAQRAPLARPADEDRDALLQRPRIAGRRLDDHRAPLEAWRPRPPHEGQQLERVLQARQALGERRELPPVQVVLALKPGRAEPHIARPPDRTSSVATIFAGCARLRCVMAVTSVPRRMRWVTPAR